MLLPFVTYWAIVFPWSGLSVQLSEGGLRLPTMKSSTASPDGATRQGQSRWRPDALLSYTRRVLDGEVRSFPRCLLPVQLAPKRLGKRGGMSVNILAPGMFANRRVDMTASSTAYKAVVKGGGLSTIRGTRELTHTQTHNTAGPFAIERVILSNVIFSLSFQFISSQPFLRSLRMYF